MQIDGKIACVTGAGGGIGRALACALSQAGAAHVICTDIDADGAAETASLCGGEAHVLDVRDRAALAALVDDVETRLGPIDIFCANAGVLTLGGIDTPEPDWQRTWEINVMAHVHAAEVMVPRMAARGGGTILTTASAAGLLSQVGSAPYSVTKHAAVGFAEWLHFSHYDDGIRVSCLCPQAVQTDMIAGHEDGVASIDGIRTPDEVATACLEAIREERFLILPHPQVAGYVKLKASDPEKWLGGMRMLHRQFSVEKT
ncbi:MAG: short-chain dehydrogenase [Rhodobacterales bacterium]|nr:MAG: short-chain dehydrogenase [Rhodobacterales bacterium]